MLKIPERLKNEIKHNLKSAKYGLVGLKERNDVDESLGDIRSNIWEFGDTGYSVYATQAVSEIERLRREENKDFLWEEMAKAAFWGAQKSLDEMSRNISKHKFYSDEGGLISGVEDPDSVRAGLVSIYMECLAYLDSLFIEHSEGRYGHLFKGGPSEYARKILQNAIIAGKKNDEKWIREAADASLEDLKFLAKNCGGLEPKAMSREVLTYMGNLRQALDFGEQYGCLSQEEIGRYNKQFDLIADYLAARVNLLPENERKTVYQNFRSGIESIFKPFGEKVGA